MLMGNSQAPLLHSWAKRLYPWQIPIKSLTRPYGFSFNISGLMSLEELVSLQLDHIKQRAENEIGNQISNVILVVSLETLRA